MNYSIAKKIDGDVDFRTLLEKIKEALKDNGFGILMEIDMKDKFKKALNKDSDEYVILGACHPQSAHEAIKSEIEIGLLLPCNVIVYEKDKEFYVSVINPEILIEISQRENLMEIANDIRRRLEASLELI